MKYSEPDYINFDPFQGDEADITLRTVKMVKTRKPHKCFSFNVSSQHEIPAGSIARYEKALIDGDYFGSYYWCIECMEKEMSEYLDDTDD